MEHKSIEVQPPIKNVEEAYLRANQWMEDNPEWMWTGDYQTQDDKSNIKVTKSSFT